jgi:UPF0716 protein FxsA
MNFFLFFLISLPILELYLIIKIGQIIGFIDVLFVIVLTALIGLFVARIQGFKILQEALRKILENKTPIFEIISGASIAVAAFLMMVPGFITDFIGLLLLIPFTRNMLISVTFKPRTQKKEENVIEGEIIDHDRE